MLGISIYPEKQDYNQIIAYIDTAAKYGFKRVFSCLLSAKESKEQLIQTFSSINDYIHSKNMIVILDVNPRVFDQFNASYNDLTFFKQLKADGIRLDMGFDGKKEADMTFNEQDLIIEINISNDNKYFDNILSYHPKKSKLWASHNFYPQRYTGLSYEFFTKITAKFKQNYIKTAAFVTSNNASIGPWELNHGLCSMEICRDLDIVAQTKLLYATELIDDVIIGNSFANEDELKALSMIDSEYKSFRLTKESLVNNTDLDNEILFLNHHFRRGDTNEYFIRSTASRVKYKNYDFKPNNTPTKLYKGDVVICNSNYAQYKGELQIVLKDCDNVDLGKNLVAKIHPDEVMLLDLVKPLERFKFDK
ncbi:DUF871 family protein [Mycoplasma sp. NEAQ87857]|uniref:DUF871 domain-containing protein n=1 Tax=Mycoplasma sp. NEAQ87857 TaxID=2683967 RepID=UPI001316B2BC|nr:MupG family TIM beta-alpha barrel fold protein [Mycoplasma sp. NEAQ87857]QGZ97518.1 DUF871 family protein [Mycoplasma sp. NEAQ87857]